MDVVDKIESVDGEEAPSSMIESLNAMSDDQLLEMCGFKDQVADMRKDLATMAKLSGKAREEAERIVEEMFEPDVSANRIHWALEDAQRLAKKNGKDELADTSPASILD